MPQATNDLPNFPKEPEIDATLAASHGLKADEFERVLKIMGRTPSFTELGIFSVMWSEHCSYKSSRLHLKKLPTQAPWVIQGPGENAGVIDIGDNQAAIFKMESHNHPSYIEPYQGAATGVGGIMRDVFTMGARPIANINALRFGDPKHPKTRRLVEGVVAGIAGYGNCMGIPTVGGEVNFHPSYNGNILVNAMTVGIAKHDEIYYARGAGVGQPVVYVGSRTGRDGIHGATMASASFDDDAEAQRPTVQVGDPFVEKLLLEACLELMQQDAIISIQDMGAAGLTSSSVEIADKGGIGVELDLNQVPQREPNMTPYEIMLSESQERMLMILKPGKEDLAREIFEKWDLEFAVIGITTDDKRLRLKMHGKVWCDMPVPPLVDEAPLYDRPQTDYPVAKAIAPVELPSGVSMTEALKKLVGCPDSASKRWVYEQYDTLVSGNVVANPGRADAALVKLPDSDKTLAISSDCTPRYCQANPYEGGKQAVAESYRNICATGALPLAVTNNLNFGNPEKPVIMRQIAECLRGMGDACRALEYPIISGNVSLYNETNDNAILPTPVIGGVGVLKDWRKAATLAFKSEGQNIYLIGNNNSHVGQSLYLREIHGQEAGDAPHIDLELERKNGVFVRQLIEQGLVTACHDVSDGGPLLAITEMALATGGASNKPSEVIGAQLSEQKASFWFSESQACYIVTSHDDEKLKAEAAKAGVSLTLMGITTAHTLQIGAEPAISINDLKLINENWLPLYMKGEA
jgi:phosphoribosylformylglycinamidine synthase II